MQYHLAMEKRNFVATVTDKKDIFARLFTTSMKETLDFFEIRGMKNINEIVIKEKSSDDKYA